MSIYDNMGGEKNMDKIIIVGAVSSVIVAASTWQMAIGL